MTAEILGFGIKGDNIFAYVVEEGTTNVQFKIENRTAFEGV